METWRTRVRYFDGRNGRWSSDRLYNLNIFQEGSRRMHKTLCIFYLLLTSIKSTSKYLLPLVVLAMIILLHCNIMFFVWLWSETKCYGKSNNNSFVIIFDCNYHFAMHDRISNTPTRYYIWWLQAIKFKSNLISFWTTIIVRNNLRQPASSNSNNPHLNACQEHTEQHDIVHT